MTTRTNNAIHIMAMAAAQGGRLSGSDRIFIELSRRWAASGQAVRIHVWEEGRQMCLRNGLPHDIIDEHPVGRAASLANRAGLLTRAHFYLVLTNRALRWARTNPPVDTDSIVYSASDFWPDVFPAVKTISKGAKWVASFYMFAPPPYRGFEGQARKTLPRPEDVFYWLSQRAVLPLIRRRAHAVLVTGPLDKERLCRLGIDPRKIIVVYGGVDLSLADSTSAEGGPTYDAVFVGRLHVQKGVRQLVNIWSRVTQRNPAARLALIGDGPLDKELHDTVQARNLSNNIALLGFLDGTEKYAIFKRSKIVLHPSVYDSGGMAPCEAFSCGLPGISFDLPELRAYYPQGMLKVPCFDLDAFADAVTRLLEDDALRRRMGQEARALAEGWDWEARAVSVARSIARALEIHDHC